MTTPLTWHCQGVWPVIKKIYKFLQLNKKKINLNLNGMYNYFLISRP